MTIAEAVKVAQKSGNRFRRKGGKWLRVGALGVVEGAEADSYSIMTLSAEGILADDWEVEQKSVTITRSDLTEAILKVGGPYVALGIAHDIAKELGL